jgi:hypothetical protein
LVGLLAAAGFADVSVRELAVPLRAGSFDEWWTRTCALAGPLAKLLASLPEGETDGLRTTLQAATKPYATSEGLVLPGVTLIAAGARS